MRDHVGHPRRMVASTYATLCRGRRLRRPVWLGLLIRLSYRLRWEAFFCACQKKAPQTPKGKALCAHLAYLPTSDRVHAEPTSASLNMTTNFASPTADSLRGRCLVCTHNVGNGAETYDVHCRGRRPRRPAGRIYSTASLDDVGPGVLTRSCAAVCSDVDCSPCGREGGRGRPPLQRILIFTKETTLLKSSDALRILVCCFIQVF